MRKILLIVLLAIIAIAALSPSFLSVPMDENKRTEAMNISGVWRDGEWKSYMIYKDRDHYQLVRDGERWRILSAVVGEGNQMLLTVELPSGLLLTLRIQEAPTTDKGRALNVEMAGIGTAIWHYERRISLEDARKIAHEDGFPDVRWSPSFSCETASAFYEKIVCMDKHLAETELSLHGLVPSMDEPSRQHYTAWKNDTLSRCTEKYCVSSALFAEKHYLESLGDVADYHLDDALSNDDAPAPDSGSSEAEEGL